MNIFIYTLIHPVTEEIRYVGKTNDLKKRLDNHIWKAASFKGSRKVYNWVQSILDAGLRPIIKSVETCNKSNWAKREMYWIAYYKNLGFDLCNLSDGGESNNGYKATKETKLLQSKRQRERHIIRPTSKDTKEAISKTLSKPVICISDGIIFPSMKSAIIETEIPKSTFHRKLHKGEEINGKKYQWYNKIKNPNSK